MTVLDDDHGSPLNAYAAMGSPVGPTQAQLEALRRAAELAPPTRSPLVDGRLELRLAPHALALIEIR